MVVIYIIKYSESETTDIFIKLPIYIFNVFIGNLDIYRDHNKIFIVKKNYQYQSKNFSLISLSYYDWSLSKIMNDIINFPYFKNH